MPVDPELLAETQAWLFKAANDLRASETLIAISQPLLGEAAYHCQQAAEKALKGFLCWNGRVFRKTHNLEEIGEQCIEVDASLRETVDRAVPLSEYAWKFRYPGDTFAPTSAEIVEAITTARAVVETVLDRLPSDVQP